MNNRNIFSHASIQSQSIISTGNTSTTPLSSGSTFTGEWERNDYFDVGVSCQTDNTGTLYFDFSNDGVNINTFPVSGFDISSGIHAFHVAVKLGRYFRVRLVNDTGAQSYLRLYTYYGQFRQGNLPLNQSINSDADSTVVRAVATGEGPLGVYGNSKRDGSAFRTTTNLGGTQIDEVKGYTDAETTSFTVDDTSSFPSSGYIYIGNEIIQYVSKTATSFDTLTRARFGTNASAILDNATVGGVYYSGILTLDGYTQVSTKILSSNTGRMYFQWFSDSNATDRIRQITPLYSTVDTYDILSAPNFGPYVVYIFCNTQNTAQTDFYFETEFYTKSVSAQVLTLNSGIVGGMTSNLTRAVIVGQIEGTSDYSNVLTTSNNELLTNTLAGNRKSRACYVASSVSANVFAIMVDLSDTVNYPHNQTNSIDVDHFSASISFSSGTAQARIRLGVITRIDGTNADISYLIADVVGVQTANDSFIYSHNYQPSSVTFKTSGGSLVGAVTNNVELAVSAVNTGITLPSSRGVSVTPAVGDVILKLVYVADSYDANISILYHSD